MLTKRGVVPAVILLAAVLFSACDDGSPAAPSPAVSRAPSSAPSPAPDLSQLLGVWNVTVRLTDVSGSGCVADTMRSQFGAPNPYSLSITQTSNYSVAVTLKSASGGRACTFVTSSVDSSGFTGGSYRCEPWFLDFRCSDGTPHSISSFGEGVSGRVSGSAISGAWEATWFDGWDENAIEMKAQFTGNRQ